MNLSENIISITSCY